MSWCPVGVASRFRVAYLEPGDGFERGADDLRQMFVAVIDAEGAIGGLDGDGATGMDIPVDEVMATSSLLICEY